MSESLTTAVIEAIAEAEEVDPTELDFSLQDHIDTDGLRLLGEHDSSSWTLRFDVGGHHVVVSGDGVIEVDGSRTQIDA